MKHYIETTIYTVFFSFLFVIHILACMYFCTLPSSNLISLVSCDTSDDEDHILWPKLKHISPSDPPNYATAIKSNGEVNGMLYLTAFLHALLLKTYTPTKLWDDVLPAHFSDACICGFSSVNECNSVRWGKYSCSLGRLLLSLTFLKINGSVRVSCH